MAIAKIIEVEAQGDTIENAVEAAVQGAGRSVRNIKGVYVKDFEGVIENGNLTGYRVNTKITFLVDEGSDMG